MKSVTQERILKALDNLYRITHKNNDKLNLELQLIEGEAPKSVEDFLCKFDRLMETVDNRRSKIHELQIKHGVSGLEWRKVNGIEFPFFDDMLRPLAVDMLKLFEFKAYVVRHWIDYSVTSGLIPHLRAESGWTPIPFDKVWITSCDFDWANIWLSKHYLSPHLLNTQSFDSPRDEAKYPGDRPHIEFHLTIGCGEDYSGTDADTLWFCAATENTL